MRYTIYLNGSACRLLNDKIVDTLEVYDYFVNGNVLEFYMDSEKKQIGFFKMEDVKYVLPKE